MYNGELHQSPETSARRLFGALQVFGRPVGCPCTLAVGTCALSGRVEPAIHTGMVEAFFADTTDHLRKSTISIADDEVAYGTLFKAFEHLVCVLFPKLRSL
mgnify:FL=1